MDAGRTLRWARWAVALLPLALYVASLGNHFLIDDELIVTANTRLAAGETPLEIFRRPEQFLDFTLPYYRPLTNLSYWADRQLWDLRPGGFHLTNWVLHGANTLLLFELLRRLAPGLAPALVGAVLFAAHPVHTESVDMVQGRTDLLMTLALLASLLALQAAVRAATLRRAWWLGALGLLAFAAALLVKEMAVTWPLLALGVWWAGREPKDARGGRALAVLAGALLVFLLYVAIRWSVLGELIPAAVRSGGSARLELVPVTLLTYLTLLVWPFTFSFIRAIPAPASWLDPQAAGGMLAAAILVAGLLRFRRRDPLAALGIGWLLITLLPVLNLFPIPGFAVAERYLYLPSIGLCLLAAALARRMAPLARAARWRTPVAAILGAVLLAFGVTIHARTMEWREPVHLYEAMAARAPESFFVQTNLGLEYLHAGRRSEAVQALTRARDLDPGNPIAWNNLGAALQESGDRVEAREAYRRAIALYPGYREARENLARLLRMAGAGPGESVSRIPPGGRAE